MRKWNFNHIVINDTLFWSILKKWMPVGRCQDDFDNEQWTHIEHWVDLLVPGTLQTKYWQLKQTIWTLSTFLVTIFSVCNKISPRKHRCESCQALMRNYFSCWRILQRRVIFAGVFYNKDTKKKTLFFQENSTKSSSWPTYGDAVGLKVNHKLLQTPQYDSRLVLV